MNDNQKNLSQIWELGLGVLRALGAQYNPVMEEAAAKTGMEMPTW